MSSNRDPSVMQNSFEFVERVFSDPVFNEAFSDGKNGKVNSTAFAIMNAFLNAMVKKNLVISREKYQEAYHFAMEHVDFVLYLTGGKQDPFL